MQGGGLEFSYTELKCKLVVNVLDGKILGNIIDIIFIPQTGKIMGFLVPGARKSFFKSSDNIFIPYSAVCKVGCDVILVELFVECKTKVPPSPKNNLIGVLEENGEEKIPVVDAKIYPS